MRSLKRVRLLPAKASSGAAAGLICAALVSGMSGAAFAQNAEVGVLRAIGGEEPVPAGGPIAVVAEIYNDTDNQIQQIIAQALTAHGYVIRFDAPLLLTFGMQRDHKVSPLPSGAIDSGMAEETTESEDEVPSVDFGDQGPVGDAPQMPDVVIEYNFGGGNAPQPSVQYNLDFVVGDSDSPPMWQGSVSASLPTADPVEAAQVLAPKLIDHLGKTVPARRVVLSQP
ncbi:MAG: hypothetical protein JNM75_04375 [Rhodospirillales bacterium]|nr:hypothetical protein [Rhodospirillales bacterium]